jgi:hypothetical protein
MTHFAGQAIPAEGPAPLTLLVNLDATLPKGFNLSDLATGGVRQRGLGMLPNSGAKALAGTGFDAAVIVRSERFAREKPGFETVLYAPANQTPPTIKGETVFLNLDVSRYNQWRMTQPEKTEQLVALLRAVLPPRVQPGARIVNGATNARQPGTELGVWSAGGSRRFLAVWHNIAMRKEGIGGEAFTDNTMFEKDVTVKVLLVHDQYVIDQRTGKEYGKTGAVEITLNPWTPILLTAQDTPFAKPSLAAPAEALRGTTFPLTITGDKQIEGALQVFRIDATNPAGQAVWYYTRKVDTRNGEAIVLLPLALNDQPGAWKFKLTDVATQATTEATVTVK